MSDRCCERFLQTNKIINTHSTRNKPVGTTQLFMHRQRHQKNQLRTEEESKLFNLFQARRYFKTCLVSSYVLWYVFLIKPKTSTNLYRPFWSSPDYNHRGFALWDSTFWANYGMLWPCWSSIVTHTDRQQNNADTADMKLVDNKKK